MVADAEVTETEETTFPRFKREFKHTRSHTSIKPQTGLVLSFFASKNTEEITVNYIKTICNPSCADNICINAKNKSDESDEKNMYECGRAMSYDIWSSGNAARIYIHAGEDGNFFPIIFDGVDINDSKYDNKVKDNTCVIPNHRTQQESASAAQTGGKHYKQKNKIYKLKYLNKIN